MKYLTRIDTLCTCTLLAMGGVACSDDETLTRAEAQQAVAAVSDSVQGGLSELARAEDPADGIEVSCVGGGLAFFSGSVDVTTAPVIVDVAAEVTFDDCKARNGVILDGAVTTTEHVEVGTAEGVRVVTELDGTVDATGAVEGSCDLNLVVEVDLTPEDGVANLVSITGSACGRDDVDEVDVSIEPIWDLQ